MRKDHQPPGSWEILRNIFHYFITIWLIKKRLADQSSTKKISCKDWVINTLINCLKIMSNYFDNQLIIMSLLKQNRLLIDGSTISNVRIFYFSLFYMTVNWIYLWVLDSYLAEKREKRNNCFGVLWTKWHIKENNTQIDQKWKEPFAAAPLPLEDSSSVGISLLNQILYAKE